MASSKLTVKVLGAKKKVTKKDAKKVKPLTNYWHERQSAAMMTGFVAGASVVLIACFVALGIVQAL